MEPLPPGALGDPRRLAALRTLCLLDTPPEESFDRITRLAVHLLDARVALVNLVDDRRQFVKSGLGLPERFGSGRDLPLSAGLCPFVVSGDAPLVLGDASREPSFRDAPPVTHAGLVAYLGVPLRDADGLTLGTLCVYDDRPRTWGEREARLLADLAALAAAEIERRRPPRPAEAGRAEAALQASETKFLALFDNLAVGIRISDLKGRTIQSNAALERMLGYSAEELRSLPYAAYTHPDDVAANQALNERMRAGLCDRFQLEKRYIRKDGSLLWTNLRVALVRDAEGVPALGIAMVEDITERKRAEAALRESEEQLRMAQKMEAVGRLAGGVAHDFNNMLQAISGFAALLLADLPERDERRLSVEQIRRAADRAADLTRQLLAFGRKQILQPRVLDLNGIVRDMVPMLSRLIGSHIDIETALETGLGPIRADPSQIEQIILNLAVNARDAMPEGGRLAIRTRDVECRDGGGPLPRALRPGRYVLLELADTGVGMDAETQARVFEPFFTTKARGEGTGLGLSTVYGVVQQSGGDIQVESAEGRGTTFRIYLPRVEGTATDEAADGPEPSPLAGSETVLLVEDEEMVRGFVGRVLRRRGYTVLEAGSGEIALDLLERYPGPIHLVLTDIVMPGAGGLELARQAAQARPGVRIILMSGHTEEAIVHDGLREQDAVFIQKPFTPDALVRMVRVALGTDAPNPGEVSG